MCKSIHSRSSKKAMEKLQPAKEASFIEASWEFNWAAEATPSARNSWLKTYRTPFAEWDFWFYLCNIQHFPVQKVQDRKGGRWTLWVKGQRVQGWIEGEVLSACAVTNSRQIFPFKVYGEKGNDHALSSGIQAADLGRTDHNDCHQTITPFIRSTTSPTCTSCTSWDNPLNAEPLRAQPKVKSKSKITTCNCTAARDAPDVIMYQSH